MSAGIIIVAEVSFKNQILEIGLAFSFVVVLTYSKSINILTYVQSIIGFEHVTEVRRPNYIHPHEDLIIYVRKRSDVNRKVDIFNNAGEKIDSQRREIDSQRREIDSQVKESTL